jgi:hypothetical protein
VRDLVVARVSQPPQLLVDLLLNEKGVFVCFVFPKTQHGKREKHKKIKIKRNKKTKVK